MVLTCTFSQVLLGKKMVGNLNALARLTTTSVLNGERLGGSKQGMFRGHFEVRAGGEVDLVIDGSTVKAIRTRPRRW